MERTLDQCIRHLQQRLGAQYDQREAKAIVGLLLEHVLHYDKVKVLLQGDKPVLGFAEERLNTLVDRILSHEPVQYVTGKARFHGHDFYVAPGVLIPRPETEMLVDKICDANTNSRDLRVLDLGTGSGCIAISIALALPFAQVIAVDLSDEALEIARRNAELLRADVRFLQADILNEDTLPPDTDFNVIVSNPPYVLQSERATMAEHVVQAEPQMALFVPDTDPLRFYKPIAHYASEHLIDGGRLYLEINQRQGEAMQELLVNEGFDQVEVLRDCFGNIRFATAQKP